MRRLFKRLKHFNFPVAGSAPSFVNSQKVQVAWNQPATSEPKAYMTKQSHRAAALHGPHAPLYARHSNVRARDRRRFFISAMPKINRKSKSQHYWNQVLHEMGVGMRRGQLPKAKPSGRARLMHAGSYRRRK